jgi:hypothetical protein
MIVAENEVDVLLMMINDLEAEDSRIVLSNVIVRCFIVAN